MAQLIEHKRDVAQAAQLLRDAQTVVDEVKPPASLVHACYQAAIQLLKGDVLLAPDPVQAAVSPLDLRHIKGGVQ